MILLPVKSSSSSSVTEWKIWVLSTTLETLDVQPENEDLLMSPTRQLDCGNDLQTDVFIIGGGNS